MSSVFKCQRWCHHLLIMTSIPSLQTSDETKNHRIVPDQQDSQEIPALESESVILPHDRTGSDFWWLQASSQQDSTVPTAKELDDEESFLYGNKVTGKHGGHSKPQETGNPALIDRHNEQDKPTFRCLVDLSDSKQPLIKTSTCQNEKIRSIFQSLDPTNISDMMVKVQGLMEEKQPGLPHTDPAAVMLPDLRNLHIQQNVESLQSLIKGESPAGTQEVLSQLSCWTFSPCQRCQGRFAAPAATLTRQIQDYSSLFSELPQYSRHVSSSVPNT